MKFPLILFFENPLFHFSYALFCHICICVTYECLVPVEKRVPDTLERELLMVVRCQVCKRTVSTLMHWATAPAPGLFVESLFLRGQVMFVLGMRSIVAVFL